MHPRSEEDGVRGANVDDVLQASSRNKNQLEWSLKDAVADGVCLKDTVIDSVDPSERS
jgi:hypothetical protein